MFVTDPPKSSALPDLVICVVKSGAFDFLFIDFLSTENLLSSVAETFSRHDNIKSQLWYGWLLFQFEVSGDGCVSSVR